MPGEIKATELAIEAKKIRSGIKILFTSGYAKDALLNNYLVNDEHIQLLSKPYKLQSLAVKLRSMLDTKYAVS